ncbi:MAG: endonuclease VII domain-containing protein [Patescibacteria group bacterium]|nr:endonuclease VII domain-containing protein [Patescibacteria group bacterium]
MNANRRKNWTEKKRKRANQKNKAWREANPERFRKARRAAKYGFSPEAQDALFAAQGNKCGCCGTGLAGGRGWNLDHDHETGRVRSFLCHACNTGLGAFKDDPARLEGAAAYLRRYGK